MWPALSLQKDFGFVHYESQKKLPPGFRSQRGFGLRLNSVLDGLNVPERGRPQYLAGEIRKHAGIHVTVETTRFWIRGLGFPRKPMLIKLAEILNVRVEWLLSGNEPMRHETSTNEDRGIYSLPITDQEKIMIDLFRKLPPNAKTDVLKYASDQYDLSRFREIYEKLDMKFRS